MKTKRILIAVVALVLAAMACQVGAAPLVAPQLPTPAASQPSVPAADTSAQAASQQNALVNLYQTVSPGVVVIQVTTQSGRALGSGFVYDTSGHIVTNYHVVQGAANNKVEVDFMSGYKTFGTVVGTDLDSDLAVVKVDAPASELHPLTLGDSSAVRVGQTAIAIGSPDALSGTMTVGIVSSLSRTQPSQHTAPGSKQPFSAGGFIQTDAAIYHGNSGGPLLNLNGEVIGINSSIEIDPNTGQPVAGVGFAISSNIIKRVTPILIRDGRIDYPYLGISSISSLSLDEINALGLKQFTGAYVTSVTKGGPADQAGIKAGSQPTSIQGLNAGGDLIVAIDGRPVHLFDDLLAYLITNKGPGDTVTLTVLRGDAKQDIKITLGKRP